MKCVRVSELQMHLVQMTVGKEKRSCEILSNCFHKTFINSELQIHELNSWNFYPQQQIQKLKIL